MLNHVNDAKGRRVVVYVIAVVVLPKGDGGVHHAHYLPFCVQDGRAGTAIVANRSNEIITCGTRVAYVDDMARRGRQGL